MRSLLEIQEEVKNLELMLKTMSNTIKSIAGYEMKHPLNHKRIKAPISGTLYQFRDNNTNFGVISTADDDKDDIKQWVKTKLQNGGITNYGKAEYYNR